MNLDILLEIEILPSEADSGILANFCTYLLEFLLCGDGRGRCSATGHIWIDDRYFPLLTCFLRPMRKADKRRQPAALHFSPVLLRIK